MPKVTLANGVSFDATADQPVLEAALACGIVLEHSCRTGRCGSCKVRMSAGSAVAMLEPVSLSDREQADGWVLTCAHAAVSDISLDVEDLGALADIRERVSPTRIDALAVVADDVLCVTLRLPPNNPLRFLAGQYVDVAGPGGVRRSYSIASDMAAGSKIELHIRRVAGGRMSAYWFGEAKPNDLLRFTGPRGTFFLRPSQDLHLVFLATGTGIAPIRSMLLQIAALPEEERPRSVALYWGGRRPEDLYMDPHEVFPWLRYVPVLSRSTEKGQWRQGYVQRIYAEDVAAGAAAALAQTAVYACGSDLMIDNARDILEKSGLPLKRFYYDAFVSSE